MSTDRKALAEECKRLVDEFARLTVLSERGRMRASELGGARNAVIAAIDRLAAAAVAAPVEVPKLKGALLRRLFNELQPLSEFHTEDELSAWWKHYAGKVRNATRRTLT